MIVEPRRRQLALSVFLAVASIVLTLGILEGIFRVLAFQADEESLQARTTTAPTPGSSVRMGQIIQPSVHRRIVFELIPGLDVVFLGAPLVTDGRGFRAGAPRDPGDGPPVRIAGLGDSVMFGWGVSGSEGFLSRLAVELSRRHPSATWTALNTAVPGYNTAMEVETLRVKALDPSPHLVVLSFVGNDLRLPNFVLERRAYLSFRRSFLVDFVRTRLEGEQGDLSPRLAYLPRQQRPADADRVPARYRDLVGPQAFHAALDELASLSRLHRFVVVVVAHPEAPPFVHEAARERGFAVVETGERVRELARERGLDGAWEPPLSLTPADPHPSALGHELIALALLEELERTGLVAQVIAGVVRERKAAPPP